MDEARMTATIALSNCDIEPLTAQDLPAAADLSRAVQWPHRLEDWQFVFTLGEGIAARQNGRLVGTAMRWTYDRKVARVGMVLVDPTIQRAGLGGKLMAALLSGVAAPAIVLNATEAGEPLYRRLGFTPSGGIVQHQGVPTSGPPVALQAGSAIRPFIPEDGADLGQLDTEAFGVARAPVIEALLRHGDVVVLDRGNRCTGFAFCRRFGRGHVIGPVAAADLASAQAMIAHWISHLANDFVRIDVPDDSGLSPWLDGLGLSRRDRANTMSLGAVPPNGTTVRTFALANQALG